MKSTSKKLSKKPVTPTQASTTTEQEKAPSDQVDTKASNPIQETPEASPNTENDMKEKKSADPVKDEPKKEPKVEGSKDKNIQKSAAAPAMQTKTPSSTPAATTPTAKLLTVFALLLAGGAVTFSALMWQQVNQLEQKLQASMNSNATQTTDAAQQQTQALEIKVDSLQRTLRGLQAEFDALDRGDKQTDLIADLYSNPKTDMFPLSIRSLLTSAELQVTLSNSVHPLLATLTSIDNHLKASGMDEQNALRQAINTDMEIIRNYPTSDPMKIAGGINTLIDQINQDSNLLTVRTRTLQAPPDVDISVDVDLSDVPSNEQPTADSSTWGAIKNALGWTAEKASEIGSATWEQLSSLVQVTPLDNNNKDISLTPNEGVVLRENIKLRLIGARISILQGQYEQANKELLDISKTIETYFDNKSADGVLHRLNELSAELKNISFPHPTHTIAALETLQSNQ